MNSTRVSISDYATGVEIWRGEMPQSSLRKYRAMMDHETGACAPASFLSEAEIISLNLKIGESQILFCEEL